MCVSSDGVIIWWFKQSRNSMHLHYSFISYLHHYCWVQCLQIFQKVFYIKNLKFLWKKNLKFNRDNIILKGFVLFTLLCEMHRLSLFVHCVNYLPCYFSKLMGLFVHLVLSNCHVKNSVNKFNHHYQKIDKSNLWINSNN